MITDQLHFRYLVCSPDLNAHGTLHGGVLLRWIDEAAGMHARKLTKKVNVTRAMSRINFVSKVNIGEIVLIETHLKSTGRTSIEFSVDVYEDMSSRKIANVAEITFVSIDSQGTPSPHGVEYASG